MDISMLSGVTSDYLTEYAKQQSLLPADEDFSSVFQAALDSLDATNSLKQTAQAEEVKFMLGDVDNPHDLLIAESKALTAIQYTNAVKDRLVEGYREIMQMQI